MNKKTHLTWMIISICLTFFNKAIFATSPPANGITTTTGITPQSLITDEFISNSCYEATNFSFYGDGLAIGAFAEGNSSIDMAEGIVLSTGRASNAHGPNSSSGISTSFNAIDIDSDLQQLIGSGIVIRDLAVLEFDFVPTQNTVTFEYVFASEEYCDYVDNYNDAFGLFISGPGINGTFSNSAENMALLPNGDPVSVSNVNHNVNPNFYVGNIPSGSSQMNDPDCNGHPIATGNTINDIEFDGFTVKMTATINVQPCETYHLKIAIADAVDGIYDSAVFLRAQSFDAGGSATVEAINPTTQTPEILESCDGAYFLFTRLNDDVSQPLTIDYNILPSSTATMGVDYQNLSGNITIPAGEMTVQLPILTTPDDLIEGNETILLELVDACECNALPIEMTILDQIPLQIALADHSTCSNEQITLSPVFSGGIPPYTFFWSDNSTSQNLTIAPAESAEYGVEITDACGNTQVASALVLVNSQPTATLEGDVLICDDVNTSAILNITTTGMGPWEISYTLNGAPQPNFQINTPSYDWSVLQNGNYELTAITDLGNGCTGIVAGLGTVQISNFSINSTSENITCFGEANGSIQITPSGGTPPYIYHWTNNATGQNPQNLNPGTYNLTVTDAIGCSIVAVFELTEPTEILAQATAITTANCLNPNGGSIQLQVAGGIGNLMFDWSNNAGTAQNPNNLSQGNYTVTITDATGCSATTMAEVDGDFQTPYANIATPETLGCDQSEIVLDASNSSMGNHFTYTWTTITGNIVFGENTLFPTVNQAGIYELLITDTNNGCQITTNTWVEGSNAVDIAIEMPGLLSCQNPTIQLDASGSSTDNDFTYEWTTATGHIITGQNSLTPIIDQPATYQLVITDLESGCTALETVEVFENFAAPIIEVAPFEEITCTQSSIVLETIASQNDNISIVFKNDQEEILNPQGASSVAITEGGEYSILMTNLESGCSSEATVFVIENTDVPAVDIFQNMDLNCENPLIDLSINTNLTDNFSIEWQSGGVVIDNDVAQISVAMENTYFATVTNLENGCFATESITVLGDFETPDIAIETPDILTCTQNEVQLQANLFTPNLMLNWTTFDGNLIDGNAEPMPMVNSAGTYFLTAQNPENGCVIMDSVTVFADAAIPEITIALPDTLTCENLQTTLVATLENANNFDLLWTTVDGEIVQQNMPLQPTIASAGTYLLTATNTQNNCQTTQSITVEENKTVPTFQLEDSVVLNCNQLTTNLLLDLDNEDNYQVLWQTANGNIIEGEQSTQPLIDAVGVYEVLLIDNLSGCTNTAEVEVIADFSFPDFGWISVDSLNCFDNAADLKIQVAEDANVQIIWLDAVGNILQPVDDFQLTVTEAGQYKCQIENLNNGCINFLEANVISNQDIPTIEIITPELLTCTQPETMLTASSNTTNLHYNWTTTDGNILMNGQTANPIINQSGNYQLTVENAQTGCMNSAMVEILANKEYPIIDAGTSIELTCNEPKYELHGTVVGAWQSFDFQWTTIDGTFLLNPDTPQPLISGAGSYFLEVTNPENGCTTLDSVLITQNEEVPMVEVIPFDTLTCLDPTVMLNGENSAVDPDFLYEWITEAGDVIANEMNTPTNEAGTYFFKITNETTGCTAQKTVVISENRVSPEGTIQAADTLTCFLPEMVLNLELTNPNHTVYWNTNDGNIQTGQTTLQPMIDANGTYQAHILDPENGCITTLETEIFTDTITPEIIDLSTENLTCINSETTIQTTMNGSNFNYNWSTNNGNIIGNTDIQNPQINAAGTYELVVQNITNGCTVSSSIAVLIDTIAPEIIDLSSEILTCINPETIIQITANGSNLTYNWTTIDGNFVNAINTANPLVNAAGTYELQIENTQNGCWTTESITINENKTTPIITLPTADTIGCQEQSLTLEALVTGSQNFATQWTLDGEIVPTATNLMLPISEAGNYQLLITDNESGCATSAMTVIEEIGSMNVDFLLEQPSCQQATGRLIFNNEEDPTLLFSIDDGASFSQQNQFDNLTAGQYQIVAQNADGCEFSETIQIDTFVELHLELENNIVISLGESIEIKTFFNFSETDIESIEWTNAETLSCNDCLEPVASPLQNTTYEVHISTVDGCQISGKVSIRVNRQVDVFAPNVFSPNGDGENDFFYLQAKENTVSKIVNFQIFDRWGAVVFIANDLPINDAESGWDGTFNQTKLNQGVFVWWAEVETIDGKQKIFKGDVTLLK